MTQYRVADGEGGKIDSFLRRKGLQQFRIRLLRESGGVYRFRGGKRDLMSAGDLRVETGDLVDVELNATYHDRLEHLPEAEYRDYVFAPKGDPKKEEDAFPDLAGRFFEAKGAIRLVDVDVLTSIARALHGNAEIDHPVRDVYLCSHANARGLLFTNFDLASRKAVDYEKVETAIAEKSLRIAPEDVSPRPRSTDGSPQPVVLRIQGCRIGDAPPMLDVLRRAFNVGRVSAPRHFDVVIAFDAMRALVEYRQYQFRRILDKPITTIKDLESIFRKSEFQLIDGQAVSAKHWDEWLKPFKAALKNRKLSPPDVPHGVEYRFPVPAKLSKLNVGSAWAKYVYYPFTYFPDCHLPASGPNPGREAQIAMIKAHLEKHRQWTAAHPYPFYVREGFPSLDAFLHGIELRLEWAEPTFNYSGKGYHYAFWIPVVDPKTKELFANVVPDPSRQPAKGKTPVQASEGIPEDERFYGVSSAQ